LETPLTWSSRPFARLSDRCLFWPPQVCGPNHSAVFGAHTLLYFLSFDINFRQPPLLHTVSPGRDVKSVPE
jgi:hypothetical protein